VPRIAIIGANHWPRAYLRAELIERGHDAVGYVTIDDALRDVARLRPTTPVPRLIVLDLLGQGADDAALAAVFRQGVPVVAVAGSTEAAQPAIRERRWAAFFQRPVTIGAIADFVDGAAKERA
jgi:hypothetical protein